MERLTTDHPDGNFETLMNFAYAKDGEVWLRGAAEYDENMPLNDFIYDVLLGDRYDCKADHPDDVPEMCLEGCFCEIGALFAAATQAAELRARLKMYEDTGLEPDEIRRVSETLQTVQRLKKEQFDQLRKYLIAEAEGRLMILPQASDRDRQSVLELYQDSRLEWIHDPSVGLYGPNEDEAALMEAIEACLQRQRPELMPMTAEAVSGRMEELTKADAERRILILPCKPGSTVFAVEYDCDACDDCEEYCGGYGGDSFCRQDYCLYPEATEGKEYVCPHHFLKIVDKEYKTWGVDRLGEMVFLTREEAEAAMEALKKGCYPDE